MNWTDITPPSEDLPYIFRKPGQTRGPALFVLSENELSIREDLYDRFVPWLDRIIEILGYSSVAVNEYSIGELMGELTAELIELGVKITIPTSFMLLFLCLRLKDRLAKLMFVGITETAVAKDSIEVTIQDEYQSSTE